MASYQIPFHPIYLTTLSTLVASPEDLQKEGYRRAAYTLEELEGLKRCRDCSGLSFSLSIFGFFFCFCFLGFLLRGCLVWLFWGMGK